MNIIFQTRSMFYGVVAVHSCVQDSMTPSHHLLFLLLFIVSHSLTMITSMNEKNECRTAAAAMAAVAAAAAHRGKRQRAPWGCCLPKQWQKHEVVRYHYYSFTTSPHHSYREDCQSLITNSTSARH